MNKLFLKPAIALIVCTTLVPQVMAERSLAEIIATGTQDEIIDQLNEGLDPNTYIEYKDLQGTVLHWVAKNGYVKVFDCIKAKYPGMNLNPAITHGPIQGLTPLHAAACNGQTEIFNWFKINCPDMDLNPSITDGDGNWKGWTPLHFAARSGKSEIFNWFKANFPRVDLNPAITDGDYCGSTPLFHAAFKGHKEIVDLLSSTMTSPEKCCFLTFEQADWNDGVAASLLNAIVLKIPAIVTPHIVKKLFGKFAWIKEYVNSGRCTMLTSSPANLIVIMPESLQDLGITIPDSEKQNPEPSIDITNIHNKYGFRNLHLLNPTCITSEVEKAQIIGDQFNELITLFESIINSTSPKHPTRFYLHGHGYTNWLIGAIPSCYFGNFLRALVTIDAEFLFIASCYAAGRNLPLIQALIQGIKGLNCAISLQAAHGGATCSGVPNINAMFTKLNDFLEDPAWALEFARDEDKPKITIVDVITSLGLKNATALPSIRLPGNSGCFRPIDEGNMEIITASKIIEKGVKKTLKLIAASKNPDKKIADEAKIKLQKSLAIDFQIKADVHYIQIFPTDLTDFNFVIQGSTMPKFISKQPGSGLHFSGQHFVGSITYSRDGKDSESAFKQFIDQGFVNVFKMEFKAESPRCWFIKSVELTFAGTTKHIKKLVIKMDPARVSTKRDYLGSYAYINHNGEFIISKEGADESTVDKETFESTIKSWFNSTKASQEILNEATGGVEITAEEKEKLIQGKSSNSRLINPQYQRTADDLFKIFMAG